MSANLYDLPDDLLEDIFDMLRLTSQLCFRLVCKRFHSISQRESLRSLWKTLLQPLKKRCEETRGLLVQITPLYERYKELSTTLTHCGIRKPKSLQHFQVPNEVGSEIDLESYKRFESEFNEIGTKFQECVWDYDTLGDQRELLLRSIYTEEILEFLKEYRHTKHFTFLQNRTHTGLDSFKRYVRFRFHGFQFFFESDLRLKKSTAKYLLKKKFLHICKSLKIYGDIIEIDEAANITTVIRVT
jgi:hypothetical protein